MGQFVGVYGSATGYFTYSVTVTASTESTIDVDALFFIYVLSDESDTTPTEGSILIKRCNYFRLLNLNKMVVRSPLINRTYMKRFFASKNTPPPVTEVSADCSEAETLVGLVCPLLLKYSSGHQGLVAYSHKLTRGLLSPLELM